MGAKDSASGSERGWTNVDNKGNNTGRTSAIADSNSVIPKRTTASESDISLDIVGSNDEKKSRRAKKIRTMNRF